MGRGKWREELKAPQGSLCCDFVAVPSTLVSPSTFSVLSDGEEVAAMARAVGDVEPAEVVFVDGLVHGEVQAF